jgi:DNA-binding transcriptional ArsR family regulator
MKQQSVFKALADPTRRSILRRLRKGSQTAGELAAAFPITRASLSHHFGILKAADLVRTERRGQHIVYSLNASVMEEVAALFMDLLGPEAGATKEQGPEAGPSNKPGPEAGPSDKPGPEAGPGDDNEETETP